MGILIAELAAGRALYDASFKNKELKKIYGDLGHDLHPINLHKTMPELQGMSDDFHDFLDEVSIFLHQNEVADGHLSQVFQSSGDRPFAVDLLERSIWLEQQVAHLVIVFV